MVSFDSLLRYDGVCSVPVVSGVIVMWSLDGSCVRIPASYDSLASVVRECREWWASGIFRYSVAFWAGGVRVCLVSAASLWAPVLGVSSSSL